jgi:hypothetical protein
MKCRSPRPHSTELILDALPGALSFFGFWTEQRDAGSMLLERLDAGLELSGKVRVQGPGAPVCSIVFLLWSPRVDTGGEMSAGYRRSLHCFSSVTRTGVLTLFRNRAAPNLKNAIASAPAMETHFTLPWSGPRASPV